MSGWHTFGVHPLERRRRSAAGTLRALGRWGLLGAVIAAVVALHVLTAEHTPSQHGTAAALPTESHSLVMLQSAGADAAAGLAVGDGLVGGVPAVAGFEHPGGGVDLLLGCVLFLVVAGPVLVLVMLRGRRAVGSPRAAGSLPVIRVLLSVRFGVPRLALCVIRI